MSDESFQSLENYALKLLSFRPRSQEEMVWRLKEYARKKSFPENKVSQIIQKFKEARLIDDENFARWWIGQRERNLKGKKLIEQELREKGIKKEIIEKVMREEKKDELNLAQEITRKKIIFFRNASWQEKKRKIFSLLLRRGFSFEIARKVIDSLSKKF